jgi:hypothetical protein
LRRCNGRLRASEGAFVESSCGFDRAALKGSEGWKASHRSDALVEG